MKKRITIAEDAYWKLLKLRAEMQCKNWEELIEKLYDLVFKGGE